MEWTSERAPASEGSLLLDEPRQHITTSTNSELARWRPAECSSTSISHDFTHDDFLTTSLEDSTVLSPIASSSDDDHESGGSEEDEDSGPDLEAPLEYARFHGLYRDYESDNPLFSELIPPPLDDFRCDVDGLEDAFDPENVLGQMHASLNERLDVSKEAATFLASLLRTCKQDADDPIRVDLQSSSLRDLRLELPVLTSDHEMDMINLRRRHEVRLVVEDIELFHLDTEKGESMGFPSIELDNKGRLDRELQNEKLDVGKETVELFRELREFTASKEVDYAIESYKAYKQRRAIHISPPLMPVTPPYSPPGPAPEAMLIDLASTPQDLLAQDVAAIEKELLELDQVSQHAQLEKSAFDAKEIAAAIESYTAASSSPLARKRFRSLHVEPPLTPQYHSEHSSEDGPSARKVKKVKFDLELNALLPNLPAENSDSLPDVAKRQMAELQETVEGGAESVQQQLQNEQLVEIDTVMRVKVLPIEAVQIMSPWNSCADAVDDSKQERHPTTVPLAVSKELLEDIHKWSGVSKIERSLSWAPFPSYLARVDLNEEFDDGSLQRYLADMNLDDGASAIDVHVMVARNHNSSLLPGDDSDYDEIEPVVMEEEEEDDDVVDQVSQDDKSTHQLPRETPPSIKANMLDLLRSKQRDLGKSTRLGVEESGNGVFTAANPVNTTSSLDVAPMQNDGITQFLQLQGKSTGVQREIARPTREFNKTMAQPAVQNLVPAAVMVPQTTNPPSETKSPVFVPGPDLSRASNAGIAIIVSSATMANRQLMRRIQALLPHITCVERDASISNATAVAPQHGGSLVREADFTISPSTGVVTTTLQKLKQKPLPGQVSTSRIRDVIATTAVRYEHLEVFVSEGNNMSTEDSVVVRELDRLDCEALVDLTSWAHSLDANVQTTYIPGGEAELAHWLAAAFSARGVDARGDMRLLHDETMWERWLRVAGLNAYAAQTVLAKLKVPHADSADGAAGVEAVQTWPHGRFGLAAFVAMTAEERVERFASVLGGEKVLRRVGEVVDRDWAAKSDRLRA